jgi:hypothetical protein
MTPTLLYVETRFRAKRRLKQPQNGPKTSTVISLITTIRAFKHQYLNTHRQQRPLSMCPSSSSLLRLSDATPLIHKDASISSDASTAVSERVNVHLLKFLITTHQDA